MHGFGGIGKSELAKKYADVYRNDYDAVIFTTYQDDLEELFTEIDIQNCDCDDDKKIKVLKKVFGQQRVLLIVDNFDVDIDADEYLDTALRFKADIIFTIM